MFYKLANSKNLCYVNVKENYMNSTINLRNLIASRGLTNTQFLNALGLKKNWFYRIEQSKFLNKDNIFNGKSIEQIIVEAGKLLNVRPEYIAVCIKYVPMKVYDCWNDGTILEMLEQEGFFDE